jgi:hypothetical protein
MELIWTIRSATGCFRLVENLTPGKSRLSEVLPLLRYSVFVNQSSPCSSERCSIGFHFESRLSWWRLIRPRRGFQGAIEVRNDTVESIRFLYAEDSNMPVSVMEGPKEADPARPGLPVGLSIIVMDSREKESIARLRDFADLPLDTRRKVLHPKLWCLVRMSGCPTMHDVLPGASSLNFADQE